MDSGIINDATMRPELIKSYQQVLLNNVFAQKLEQNEIQTKTVTDYKNKHKKVIEGLQVYPLSISENCMVPIGKRAFMKGKLVHTNEILASLGDGYFAKYSASQAIALCNRRITWADEMLKSLETERNLYEMRQYLPLEHDVFGKENEKNIVEHWTDSKLDEWKVQHRQREKEYHQKLAKLREKENTDIRTEEDLFKRLDELEVEEDLEDEIYRLEAEQKKFSGDFEFYDDLEDDEIYDESDEDVSDSDQTALEIIQEEIKTWETIQMTKLANTSNINSDAIQDKTLDANATGNEQADSPAIPEKLRESGSPEPREVSTDTNTKERRRISFAEPCVKEDKSTEEEIPISPETCFAPERDYACDESSEDEDDTVRIEFSHSSHISDIPESNSTDIQSPIDIYKMFNAPKSILKRSPNDIILTQVPPPLNEDSNTDSENEDYARPSYSVFNSVIKEKVQENTSSVSDVPTKNEKRISRFKLERAGKKQ